MSVAVTTRAQRVAVWSAASAAFLSGLDGSVVGVALPVITEGFDADMGTATWVTAGYMVTLSCVLLPAGRLLDRYGAWRFLFLGFTGFILASVGCAASTSMAMLIGLRCLQGGCAGMLVVSAFAIVPRVFPGEAQAVARGSAFATLSVSAALGAALGGPLGGLLCQYVSWQWVFLINVPVGALAAWQASRFARKDRVAAADKKRPLEPVAVLAGMLMLAAAMIGLNRGDEWGWSSLPVTGAFSCALLAALVFFHRERAAADPLVAWEALAKPVVRRGFILATLAYLYLSGLQLLLPFDLIDQRHFSAGAVGAAMLTYSLPLMAAGALSGRVSKALGLAHCQALAMALVATGSLALAFSAGLALTLSGMALCGAGFGLFTAPNNSAVMSAESAGGQGRLAGSFQSVVRVSIASGAIVFEALHTLFVQLRGGSGAAVEAFGFRASYQAGAALCLLVAVLALAFRPAKVAQTA